jgi:hypothetical protein
MGVTRAFVAALVVACFAATATAGELDRKTILQLLPCKSAALRLCDRSQGPLCGGALQRSSSDEMKWVNAASPC